MLTFFFLFSREFIPQGKSGGLVIFQDRPNAFDAWGELSNEHRFSWVVVMSHEGHSSESDIPVAGHLYNSPLRGKSSSYFLTQLV